jgi:hypothetical protein
MQIPESLDNERIIIEKLVKLCLREIKDREASQNNNQKDLKQKIKTKVLEAKINEN